MRQYLWDSGRIKTALANTKAIELRVAVAFLSAYGSRLIIDVIRRNRLPRSAARVYLSTVFSADNPAGLLRELSQHAEVYLTDKRTLHAKVMWFRGQPSTLFFGSSNLTLGGMENNLEFNQIETDVPTDAQRELLSFFEFCHAQSIPITAELIKEYDARASKLDELRRLQRALEQEMFDPIRSGDPFRPDTYEIDDYFFTFEDYEVFFDRFADKSDTVIMRRRASVQQKLLSIHQALAPHMRRLNLHHHWDPNHITSLIHRCAFNHGKVNWLGVRYGKSQAEIDLTRAPIVNNRRSKEEPDFGFHKHACVQFSIGDRFHVSLFHAVAREAVDRDYLRSKLDSTLAAEISDQLRSLDGEGFEWVLERPETLQPVARFVVDDEDPDDFVDWYRQNDREGYASFLIKTLEPDDPQLKSKEAVVHFVQTYLKRLAPLHRLISWRAP